VTLLVTYRFSTVASADLVVVLDHGRVEEMGTDGELVSSRGQYAELYELQAGVPEVIGSLIGVQCP
jgi:ATP-binding cassette subfamily B protein